MRNTLALILSFWAGSISAQYYSKNATVQQAQVPVDCYTLNLDNGNSALRRGETYEAMRYFMEAKQCPESQGNARRQAELDIRIARCEELLGVKNSAPKIAQQEKLNTNETRAKATANMPAVARRKYLPTPGFLKDTLEDCFHRIVDEADRAYRFSFWDEAAALYRAAKNCADANQQDRMRMSARIQDCRDASYDELFSKQQEAERQARHAIAANLADDAQKLLQNTDRSLAFRLADFANQYVAPDDNADCQQAMFDAWYYQPTEETKHDPKALYRPVFCYELAENLGENTQVKFEQLKNGDQWLWAFVPKEGEMTAWEMPSMKRVQSYAVGEGNDFIGFDISPDRSHLFWGTRFFEIRRGAKSIRVDVPSVAQWCFNARGDEFFYQNTAEQKIYVLDVRDAFAQQNIKKGSKNANNLSIPLKREIVSGISADLMAMQYVDGKFWLGYSDRVEILSKDESRKHWKKQTIRFEGLDIPESIEPKDLRLLMYPKAGFAVLGCQQKSWSISLKPEIKRPVQVLENLYPLAANATSKQIACEYTGHYPFDGFWLIDAETGDTLLRQPILAYKSYPLLNGSFSPDGHWIAASSNSGYLSVWALQDAPSIWKKYYSSQLNDKPLFSPNGERLFASVNDTLSILNTSQSEFPELFWPNKGGTPLRGASDHWALVQVSPDSAEARHLTDGRRLKFPLKNEGVPYLFDFESKTGKYVAYLSDWNKIEVRSLQNGALVASRTFDVGSSIGDLRFIPGTENLLVVQHVAIGESEMGQSSVKIWSPMNPAQKPQAIRLHEYGVLNTALNNEGTQIAVTNGSDIRIFDLSSPENETQKIRATIDKMLMAIAFRPNSNLIAAAYSDGKVIFWDIYSGQSILQLQAVALPQGAGDVANIASIGFSQNGSVLHLATMGGQLISYALDPSFIRAVAQDENRQLQSFSTEQIVEFNLESALYYAGNFDRLAESGDGPLLRSFFRYFSEQAVQSNNIERVRDYCERALFLYERLDPNTRKQWKTDMSTMYENYAWKLLLRNKTSEANAVVTYIRRNLNYEPVILNAHLALLARDFAKASALYTTYFLDDPIGLPSPAETKLRFESVESELSQLRDFEVLDNKQLSSFCGMVSLSEGAFPNVCPEGSSAPGLFSPNDQIRWEIFQKRLEGSNTLRLGIQAKLLEEAQINAKKLVKNNAPGGQKWLEDITWELAQAYRKWGGFELKSSEAGLHFDKAVRLLTDSGDFQMHSDTSRLSLLLSTRLAWGNHLLEAGKSAEALVQFQSGAEAAQPLSELAYRADTTLLRNYYDNLVSPLFEKMGTALLLEGRASDARNAYQMANNYAMSLGGIPGYFQANVSIFENDEVQAFLDYGTVSTPRQAADAFFILQLLAEKFPDQRSRLESFVSRLKEGFSENNPRLVNTEMDYWFAKCNIEYYAARSQWDSAAVWSTRAYQSATRSLELPKAEATWPSLWLDEHIDVPYYLLLSQWNKPEALETCIETVERADAYLQQLDSIGYFYYSNRELLKTNLAHALALRNQPGDRDRALAIYKQFVETNADTRGYDNLDLLEKDFKDLIHVGAPASAFPKLETLVEDE